MVTQGPVSEQLKKKFLSVLEHARSRAVMSARVAFCSGVFGMLVGGAACLASRMDMGATAIFTGFSAVIGGGVALFFRCEAVTIQRDIDGMQIQELSGTPQKVSIYSGKGGITRVTIEGRTVTLPVRNFSSERLTIKIAPHSKIVIDWT